MDYAGQYFSTESSMARSTAVSSLLDPQILFDGMDVSSSNGTCSATPFIDTRCFNFQYGDTSTGKRVIDSQLASSTKYMSTTMTIQSSGIQQNQRARKPDQGGQPSQEALTACLGLSQGAACAVNTPNGIITSSFTAVQSSQLACVPADGPPSP